MGTDKLVIVQHRIDSPKIPRSFSGFRIAVISDLHNCSLGSENHLLLEAVLSQEPDVVLIAGDMITEEKLGDGVQYERALNVVRQIGKVVPVYYGMGNHEQRWKERNVSERYDFESFVEELELAGVCVLDNRSVRLCRGGDMIRVTGLGLPNRFFNKKKIVRLSADQIKALVGPADSDHYQILIGHSPQFFQAYAEWGADLTLAGHYHGGVIRLPFLGGVISTNFRLFPAYDYGRFWGKKFHLPKREMLVTSGLGCHTIPIRINNPAEVVILELNGEA